MHPPPDVQRPAPAAIPGGPREMIRLGGGIGVTDTTPRRRAQARQRLAEITGALAMLAHWRARIAAQIARGSDMTCGELLGLPHEVAAYRRAARACAAWLRDTGGAA